MIHFLYQNVPSLTKHRPDVIMKPFSPTQYLGCNKSQEPRHDSSRLFVSPWRSWKRSVYGAILAQNSGLIRDVSRATCCYEQLNLLAYVLNDQLKISHHLNTPTLGDSVHHVFISDVSKLAILFSVSWFIYHICIMLTTIFIYKL